jgi:hypothetical protein
LVSPFAAFGYFAWYFSLNTDSASSASRRLSTLQILCRLALTLTLHDFRHTVHNIGGLMNPTTLLAGRRKDFSKRRPETQIAVANG